MTIRRFITRQQYNLISENSRSVATADELTELEECGITSFPEIVIRYLKKFNCFKEDVPDDDEFNVLTHRFLIFETEEDEFIFWLKQ